MGFKLKDNNVPSEFKDNYIRPTSLNIRKNTVLPNTEYEESSALKQTTVPGASSPGSTFLSKIGNLGSAFIDKIKESDWEDFIIPQQIQNQVPINVRAFASDLMGRDRDITERHLSKRELKALTEARERAEARGSDRIEYKDYATGDNPYADVGGDSEESTLDFLKKNFVLGHYP